MQRALIGVGFSLIGSTQIHRWAPTTLRGMGAILMFHHVRPRSNQAFQPNGLLEITPEFLDSLIGHLRARGYDIISLDDAVRRCGSVGADPSGADRSAKPFAVLTFDDGYRDNAVYAMPVLERHKAPFTLYVTPGFADRTARLWWVELEEAILRLDRIEIEIAGEALHLRARSAGEKWTAWTAIYSRLRQGNEEQLLDVIKRLGDAVGLDRAAIAADQCMDWAELLRIARHPLSTIGAHTISHPRLAKLDEAAMLAEMEDSRSVIEARTGLVVRHLAYPVGDPTSAGQREFDAARSLGFLSAVTTRPGLVFTEHASHMLALPRMSINGNWQDLRKIDVLLSGVAFALWNRGRRVNVA